MEFAAPLSNLRTQLCMIVTGFDPSIDRELIWPEAAEEFLRKMHKLGIHITIVGPRPSRKFGSKKTIRFMDRHEVIGMKVLEASRSHRLEFRVLSGTTQAWTRLRAEACITYGPYGVWPSTYPGWNAPGTMSINALSRWVVEQKNVPGREFAFLGSSNQAVRWASALLDRGARACYIIEPGPGLRCWRSHRDRLIAKGGRFLVKHQIQRVVSKANNSLELYLGNDQGTLIVPADTIVLAPANDDALNSPVQWKRGLFYIQKRVPPFDSKMKLFDEELWLETADWSETYWRVAKSLELVDHSDAEGALKLAKLSRRQLLEYRRTPKRIDLGYSGKILDRETIARVQSSVSVPRSFAKPKPTASLECFENIPCRACADACPENAIEVAKIIDFPKLIEDRCTGCGACVAVCPSGAAVMVRELAVEQKARYFLADDTKELWKTGRALQLLNRRGEALGMGRVVSSQSSVEGLHRILEIESTNFNLWEARNFRVPAAEQAMNETRPNIQDQQRRGWITLNGVKRLCPVEVPITIALWQLGRRRFEDALFCHDGSCHLCEVRVNGLPALACKTIAKEGQSIEFDAGKESQAGSAPANPLCYCRQLTADEYATSILDGVPESLARELTGLGTGTCHGRWCLGSSALCKGDKLRPVFHGYEGSPWRDVWTEDVSEIDPVE